jgi:tRNA(fMet)-specific endonuclease VapC
MKMNGSILDTVFISKVIDKDPVALDILSRIERKYTSLIVVGELYFAADNSGHPDQNHKTYRKVLETLKIVPMNDKVAQCYSKIKLHLKQKGKKIPSNDLWIAACAAAYGMSVATFDGHFDDIEEITVVR